MVSVKKRDWAKDRVYLYQFLPYSSMPNLSPFCLKVETFLLAYNIDYEPVNSFSVRSKNGLAPFIELNGEHVADSQFIIEHLKKHFKIVDDPSNVAQIRAFDRLADCSLFFALYWDKMVKSGSKAAQPELIGLNIPTFLHGAFSTYAGWRLGGKARSRIQSMLGNLSEAEINQVMRQDIAAFAEQLGNKPFLFGDKITSADCTFFAHLASCYYLPFAQPIQKLLQDDHPNLVDYLERVKSTVYPNWPKAKRAGKAEENPAKPN